MLRYKSWLSLITVWAAGTFALWAADATSDLPARRIIAAFQYPGITIAPEDSISVDLLIKNRGRSDETVLIEVTEQRTVRADFGATGAAGPGGEV